MKHKVKRVHFVGIGGAGMSGIAEVLLDLGFDVSGSDLRDNAVTQRMKALGATGLKRESIFPDLPTVAEQGFPGYEDYTWIGFFAPTGTPKAIVVKLNAEIAKVIAMPDVKERLAVLGFDPVQNNVEQFTTYIREEVTKWAKVIKDSGAKVD